MLRRGLHGWKTLSEMKAAGKISVKLLGMMISVKAGQDALRRGATSEEAVAAIHAAGAESSGPKFFGASIGRILWEDTATSLIAESEVVGNRLARFGTSEERATIAEIAAEVSGLTRGERTDGACSDQLSAVICRRRVREPPTREGGKEERERE